MSLFLSISAVLAEHSDDALSGGEKKGAHSRRETELQLSGLD